MSKPVAVYALLLILVLSLGGARTTLAQASQPTQAKVVSDISLPATVFVFANTTATLHCDLIQIGGSITDIPESTAGFGSGFFINSHGYILTDGHVVNALTSSDPNQDEVVKGNLVSALTVQVIQYEQQQGNKLDQSQVQSLLLQSCTVTHAKTVAKVLLGVSQASGIQPVPLPATVIGTPSPFVQRDFAILKVDVENTPSLLLGDSAAVQVGDSVYAMGFPGVVVLNDVLNSNRFLEPSFTSGIVSASRETSSGNPVFQIDASVTHGNSGGPVLNGQGRVIGLVDFGSINQNTGQEIAGFNFITKSSSALNYLKENGVTNEQGQNDLLYGQGLSYYYYGMYASAINAFQTISNTYKYNWHAADLISQSQQRINSNEAALPKIILEPPQTTTQGSEVKVSGTVQLSQTPIPGLKAPNVDWSKIKITLTYTLAGGESVAHSVTPSQQGAFTDSFTPSSSGTYSVEAKSPAGGDFGVASSTIQLAVSASPLGEIIGVGIVLIILIVAAFFAIRRRRGSSAQNAEANKGVLAQTAVLPTARPAGFCPNCGSPASQETSFCPNCGKKL